MMQVEAPAQEFWAAAFAAASRFTELLTATLGPSDGRVAHLVKWSQLARPLFPPAHD